MTSYTDCADIIMYFPHHHSYNMFNCPRPFKALRIRSMLHWHWFLLRYIHSQHLFSIRRRR